MALGTGASLTLGTTGVTLLCTSISSGGITWTAVETSHLGTTGARTFVRGDLYDPGEITVQYQADPDDMDTLLTNSASETVTITYSDTPAATEASSGFVTSWDPATNELEGLVMGSLTIKRTGAITFADGT